MDGALKTSAAVDYGRAGREALTTRVGVLHDGRRARSLPYKLYLPARPRALIVFSHGLAGSRECAGLWLGHWASWGFAGLAVQHPGSDMALLHNHSPLGLRRAFKDALNPLHLAERAADIRYVLTRIGRDDALPDAATIGLAGHSFGAVTMQLVAGERRAQHAHAAPDSRVRAALALSPSARYDESSLSHRFGSLHLPFMSLTGSRDDGLGPGDITAANRELPYRHMPPGNKYLLVFGGGTHLDFAGQTPLGEGRLHYLQRSAPSFQPQLLAAATAFWLGQLAGEDQARRFLHDDLAGLLRPIDRYEHK